MGSVSSYAIHLLLHTYKMYQIDVKIKLRTIKRNCRGVL